MNKIFIICGHGKFGTALQSNIELLLGKNKDIYYIDFLEDDNEVSLREKIMDTIKKNSKSQILFICDIMGGTPFKLAAEIANDNEDIEVVAGCNVMSIIEGSFNKDDFTLEDLAKFVVESSKNSTMKFEKIISNGLKEEVKDGI